MNAIVNIVMFQTGWLACVISLNHQLEWLALTLLAFVITAHLFMVNDARPDILIILITGICGLLVDSTMISQKLLLSDWKVAINGWAPLWLVGLWMLFGTTMYHSLAWFQRHLWLAAIAGFIFAPLSYLAGSKLGVLQFSSDIGMYLILLYIALIWFFVTPFLLWLARTLQLWFRVPRHT